MRKRWRLRAIPDGSRADDIPGRYTMVGTEVLHRGGRRTAELDATATTTHTATASAVGNGSRTGEADDDDGNGQEPVLLLAESTAVDQRATGATAAHPMGILRGRLDGRKGRVLGHRPRRNTASRETDEVYA